MNEPIHLYEGSIELVRARDVLRRGAGAIRFEWLPTPRIAYELDSDLVGKPDDLGDATLRVLDTPIPAEAAVTINRVMVGAGQAAGLLSEPLVIGSPDPVAFVRFQIPNTRGWLGEVLTDGRQMWRGRTVLESDPWRVTLDSRAEENEATKELRGSGGFRFTFVGQLERLDGADLTLEETRLALSGLHYFLALARGFWTPPLLPVGYDASGKEVWREWALKHVTAWRTTSWYSHMKPETLQAAFRGFVRRWLDKDWRETFELAIVWFVEANGTIWAENSVILAQAGLELLSWVTIVDELKQEGRSSFRKKPANEKMGHLLTWARIPTAVPSPLLAAQAFAPGEDGPTAIAQLRNAIVHGRNRARVLSADPQARIELRTLALWYLELVLLRLSDFQGDYLSRIESTHVSDTRSVPWATGLSGGNS